MNIALVAGENEVEEMADRPRLVLHRRPRTTKVFTLVCKETVDIVRLSGPDRTPEEPHELEQHRPVTAHHTVAQPGTHRSEQILIDQLLLEILQLLRRVQPARRTQGPNHRQRHRHLRVRPLSWSNPTIAHEPRRFVGNPDGVSDIHRRRLRRTWPEQQRPDTRDGQLERRELPATDPAELAVRELDTGDDSYVDLGVAA
ncbi:hypothetical protein ACPZ19_23530 [Amycolatopsis lurida]